MASFLGELERSMREYRNAAKALSKEISPREYGESLKKRRKKRRKQK